VSAPQAGLTTTLKAEESRALAPLCANFSEPQEPSVQPWQGSEFMTIYVAEVKGRGIAAFHADSGLAAECVVSDRLFRDDLMALASGGLPLWDGVTEFQIRQALPGEDAKWRTSRARAIAQGSIEEDDNAWIAFLVALTDPARRKR